MDGEHPLALMGSRREAGPQSFLDGFLKLSRGKTSPRTAEIKGDSVLRCRGGTAQGLPEGAGGKQCLIVVYKMVSAIPKGICDSKYPGKCWRLS